MPAQRQEDDTCARKYVGGNAAQVDTLRRLDALERRGDRFAADLSRARETPWAILIGGISVLLLILGMLSGLYLQWINSEVEPLSEFVKYNFGQIEKGFDLTRVDRGDIKSEFSEDVRLLRDETKQLRDSVFPSKVHEQRWELYDLEIKALQDRIREINDRIADLYSPADKFKELQTQLDQIRDLVDRKFMNGYMAPAPPPPTNHVTPTPQ